MLDRLFPRFAYTIGGKDLFGADITFCGGETFIADEVSHIIREIVEALKKGTNWKELSVEVPGLGSFTLAMAHISWAKLIAPGIFDMYNQGDAIVLQILPDQERWSVDIPNTEKEFNAEQEPVWQWLVKEWSYPIPQSSTVVTDVGVLRGEKATEVMRWEEDEWEIFSSPGPEVPKDNMRAMPLAILLGIDSTLEPAVNLSIGSGLRRDAHDLIWHDWQ